jgi:chromosome segregation ATPase
VLAVESKALVELKSAKIQLEVSLIYLRRKHTDLHRQSERLGREATSLSAPESVRLSAELRAIANDIASREAQIGRLDAEIARNERSSIEESVEELTSRNDSLADELASLREDTLARLRALVSNLRRYEDLTDRKNKVVKRLSEASGRDLSYANYIECAFARQSDLDSELQFVLDYLKRVRIVA